MAFRFFNCKRASYSFTKVQGYLTETVTFSISPIGRRAPRSEPGTRVSSVSYHHVNASVKLTTNTKQVCIHVGGITDVSWGRGLRGQRQIAILKRIRGCANRRRSSRTSSLVEKVESYSSPANMSSKSVATVRNADVTEGESRLSQLRRPCYNDVSSRTRRIQHPLRHEKRFGKAREPPAVVAKSGVDH